MKTIVCGSIASIHFLLAFSFLTVRRPWFLLQKSDIISAGHFPSDTPCSPQAALLSPLDEIITLYDMTAAWRQRRIDAALTFNMAFSHALSARNNEIAQSAT